MGYLERIFLGSMLLTALLILFLFGLYFDFGAMFAGGIIGRGIGYGQDLEMIRQRRRLAVVGDEEGNGADLRPHTAPTHTASTAINYDAYVRRGETVPMEVLVEREVRRLKRKGHTDDEFIRMRAVYEVDRTLVSIFDQYDRLVEAGDLDAAIDLLLEARKGLAKDNLLSQRDVLQYLQQAYVLAGRQQEASQTMMELVSLQERIFGVEQRAEMYRDSAGQAYLEKMQEGFGQLREALDKIRTAPDEATPYSPLDPRVAEAFQTGQSKVPINEQHLRIIKADLMKRLESGGEDSLTQEQMKQILDRFQAR